MADNQIIVQPNFTLVTSSPQVSTASSGGSGGGGGGSGLPALIGQQFAALMETPIGVAAWARVTQDMILPAFTISLGLTGASQVEVGQTVATPAFTASYARTAAAAVLTDDQGTAPRNVIATPTAFSSSGTFVKNSYGSVANFTLTANETGGPSKTSGASIQWLQRVFLGVAVPGTLNAAFITALANNPIASGYGRTFSVTAGATQKIYYAFRSAYGTPTFSVGGFAGGFSLVASAVAVTNAFAFTENYDLWASDNLNLGATTVVVQ